MVDIRYTLTCDHCRHYLVSVNKLATETGDLDSLLEIATERGWLLEWEPGTAGGEPAKAHCPPCAKKLGESINAKP